MRFESVQTIFYQYIPRRYHRFCRELFNQILCLYLTVKPAYLFDLFPLSIRDMRLLLASLSSQLPFPSLLLKYSLNDLIIINRSQITQLLDSTVLTIDLTAMTTSESHPMIDQVRDHLKWIVDQEPSRLDFDNEVDRDWADAVQRLNHTTVFGYLLGYPLIYFYSLTAATIDVNSLTNYRLYVTIEEEISLYSFSSPIDARLDQTKIEAQVQRWYASLSQQMASMGTIKQHRLEKQIREESAWCL